MTAPDDARITRLARLLCEEMGLDPDEPWTWHEPLDGALVRGGLTRAEAMEGTARRLLAERRALARLDVEEG